MYKRQMVALVPTVVPTMIRVSGKTQIIKIRKGTLRRILTVSYTHLDVYKRQVKIGLYH